MDNSKMIYDKVAVVISNEQDIDTFYNFARLNDVVWASGYPFDIDNLLDKTPYPFVLYMFPNEGCTWSSFEALKDKPINGVEAKCPVVRCKLSDLTAVIHGANNQVKLSTVMFENGGYINLHSNNSTNGLITEQSHYREAGIEPIDLMKQNFTREEYEGFLQGNVLKYMLRYKRKNGVEDVIKAKTYITWLIESMEENEEN